MWLDDDELESPLKNEIDRTDLTTYAPFVLMDQGESSALFLSDTHMMAKTAIFEEREDEGWSGNGYDWNSIAQVVVTEQLPELEEVLSFDPEGGTFSAHGPRSALKALGKAMAAIFHSDEAIRDLLSRAELD